LSRGSILLGSIGVALALAGSVPAGATVRTANYSWAPATGPVFAYLVYRSIDGGAEEFYTYVTQTNVAIEVDSGASLRVSVAAFDVVGNVGPRSDVSAPVRLCPGDFDGDEVIRTGDANRVSACINQAAAGACNGADMNGDGYVTVSDYLSLKIGTNACPNVAPAATCPGDMDRDGSITLLDLFAVRTCVGLARQGNCTYADYDGSGFVTMSDLIMVSQHVGKLACAP